MPKLKKVKVGKAEVKEEAKPEKKKVGAFHLTIETGDEVFEIDTDTLVEGIKAFKPAIIKTTTVIRATYQERTVEKILFVIQARRLFNNPIAAEIFAKNLKLALNATR